MLPVPEGAWGVSTHRRAWFIRAGIVVLLAGAGLFGLASPALAANPDVTITSLSSGSLNSGDSATLKFKVKNNNPTDASFQIAVTFPGFAASDVTCSGQCTFTQLVPGMQTSAEFTATIKAGNVGAGQTKNGTVRITAKAGSDTDLAENPLSVTGPAQQATVPEVSGTVVDVFTGQPIDAATVSIQDSAAPAAHTYSVGTDKNGVYKFTSTSDKPIAAGIIAFMVEKNGLAPFQGVTKQANPGQALTNVKLSVAPLSSTASPTNQPSQTTNPQNTATLQPDETRNVTGGDGGGLSWVLIAIGGVLVLLGIGAIVLLLVRRNGNGGGDEDDDGRGGPRGGGPGGRGPGGRGGPGRGGQGGPGGPRRGPGGPGGPGGPAGPGGPYDPTRPMRSPVSPGPRAEQTVIAPSPLAGGGQPRGGRPGQGGPGPNGYGQQYPGGAGYGGPQGQYGQQGGGDYPGGHDSYNQDQYGQPGYGSGPRPSGPGQQPDGRRVDWMDD
jgi:hypothetical protein